MLAPAMTTHDLPAGPPPEVLEQIDRAWERSQELFESDLDLHFEIDDVHGRVTAELRYGSVVERLSASEALALACGDLTPQLAVAA